MPTHVSQTITNALFETSPWPTSWIKTTATATSTIWVDWCRTGTEHTVEFVTDRNSTSTAWTYWMETGTVGTVATPRVRTAEEIAADDARMAAYRAQQAAASLARQAAEKRAEELLVAHLAPAQREQFLREGSFIVEGSDGLRFRIRRGRTANVDVISADGLIESHLCAHPSRMVPDFDTMLAQKLMLESDPASFIRVANRRTPHSRERVLAPLH